MKWLPRLFTAPSDERELLDLIDERRVSTGLYGNRTGLVTAAPQHPPVTFPDGSSSESTRALDVIADMLAAPPLPDDAA